MALNVVCCEAVTCLESWESERAREGKPKECRGPLSKFGIEKDVERSDLAVANNDDIQSGVVRGLAFRA